MGEQRRLVIAAVILLLAGAALLVVAYGGYGKAPKGGSNVQNILIVASVAGFNDSANHGVPANPWPVIHVAKGTMVNVTVYNNDKQAHGFQVAHYFESGIQTIAPGQKLNVSFVADETGTFRIYCSIFCTVHWAMQSGELIVA